MLLLFFLDRIICSPGWSPTFHIAEAGCKLLILLFPPSKGRATVHGSSQFFCHLPFPVRGKFCSTWAQEDCLRKSIPGSKFPADKSYIISQTHSRQLSTLGTNLFLKNISCMRKLECFKEKFSSILKGKGFTCQIILEKNLSYIQFWVHCQATLVVYHLWDFLV